MLQPNCLSHSSEFYRYYVMTSPRLPFFFFLKKNYKFSFFFSMNKVNVVLIKFLHHLTYRVMERELNGYTTRVHWCPQGKTSKTCSKNMRGRFKRQSAKHALIKSRTRSNFEVDPRHAPSPYKWQCCRFR